MNTFDIAKSWHRMFALHVEFVLDGVEQSKLDPSGLSDEAACGMGKWITGPGARYAHLPEFAELVAKHAHFHAIAGEMLKDHLAGRRTAAKQLQARSFGSASDAVLAAIDALAAHVFADTRMTEAAGQEGGVRRESHWRESMRIGERLLDEQHIELANLIDHLNDDPTAPITAESFVTAISAVDKLTALHFETEEIFMQRVGYPLHLMEEHVKEHERLLRLFLQIDLDIMAGSSMAAADVYQKVDTEVINHILDYDSKLSDYATNQE